MSQVTNELLVVPKRVVKPRKVNERPPRPVIAIFNQDTLNEADEPGTVDELVQELRHLPASLFVSVNAADFVGHLNTVFCLRYPGEWQWRATTHERDICRPDGERMATRVTTVIHYFGFKNGQFHKIIDPVGIYGMRFEKMWGSNPSLADLLAWGGMVRDFCYENSIDVRPTSGGIGAQLLTDRRFYPSARRKVPATINESVREQLPGNHYHLDITPSTDSDYRAFYLDQHRAHHYHARTTALPDSNTLYAHGRFMDLAEVVLEDTWDNFHGLYCLDLEAPDKLIPFTWLDHRDLTKQFVYSCELPYLRDLGYRTLGVRAAWGSRKRDTGLARYAEWAEAQLDRYRDAPWIKPLLLATYGTLATRPKYAESIFRLSKTGETVTLRTGRRTLNGRLSRSSRKLEPRIANVLHRGMIEASTRCDSIGLAQWLTNCHWRVLSIYADGVIVECNDDKELPSLPEPWRCKQTLNHLQFIHQQAFVSDGMTKLPGVGAELRKFPLRVSAPTRPMYEAVTGKTISTNRRI